MAVTMTPATEGSSGGGRPAVPSRSTDTGKPPREPWENWKPWLNLATVVVAAIVAVAVIFMVSLLRDRTVPVLALVRDVGWGQQIAADDVGVVDIVPDQDTKVISVDEKPNVLGKVPTFHLSRGTVLSYELLNAMRAPLSGLHVVGLRTEVGQRPAQELRPGAYVCVSLLPNGRPCDGEGVAAGSFHARVAELGPPDHRGVVVVDVVVGLDEYGPALAAASRPVLISLVGG